MDWDKSLDEATIRAKRKNELWMDAVQMSRVGLLPIWYGQLSDDDRAMVNEIRDLVEQATSDLIVRLQAQLDAFASASLKAAQLISEMAQVMEKAMQQFDLGEEE